MVWLRSYWLSRHTKLTPLKSGKFIQQVFIVHLLHIWHHSKHWVHPGGKSQSVPSEWAKNSILSIQQIFVPVQCQVLLIWVKYKCFSKISQTKNAVLCICACVCKKLALEKRRNSPSVRTGGKGDKSLGGFIMRRWVGHFQFLLSLQWRQQQGHQLKMRTDESGSWRFEGRERERDLKVWNSHSWEWELGEWMNSGNVGSA